MAFVVAVSVGGARAPLAMTFDEVIGLAQDSPAVLSARKAAERHRELSRGISVFTDNPEILIDPGYRFQVEQNRGVEGGISVELPWNLGGLSSRRREAAAAEGDALAEQARLTALSQRLEAARLWIELVGAERELEVVERARTIAEELVSRTVRRVELGEATALDLSRARGLVAASRVEAVDVEGRREELSLALSGIVSDVPTTELATSGPLPHPELPPGDGWMNEHAFQRVPQARLRLLQARAQRARAAEVKAEAAGELGIGAWIRREAPDDYIAGAVLSWTPALLDRGHRQRLTEESQAILALSEAELAVQDARTLVATAFHEVEHTEAKLSVLRDELVPNVDETVRLATRLVDVGEETLTELLRSQREALEARRALVRAESDHAWARVRLWLYLATLSAEGEVK